VLTLINLFVFEIPVLNQFHRGVFGFKSVLVRNDGGIFGDDHGNMSGDKTSVTENDDYISEKILGGGRNEKQYTTTDIIDSTFAMLQLSQKDLNTLKNIYYEPNPDPESKEGEICGTAEKSCKWCSASYSINMVYVTFKSIIEKLTNPFGKFALDVGLIFGDSSELKTEIEKACEQYRNGQNYECADDERTGEFCSLKCKNEYKIFK
jgi:hypothetical protein